MELVALLKGRTVIVLGLIKPRVINPQGGWGGTMRERWEDSTGTVVVTNPISRGSNKPVAPISRLLFSPREEPLVEDSTGGYPKSSGYPERGRCVGKQTLSVANKRRQKGSFKGPASENTDQQSNAEQRLRMTHLFLVT